MGLENGDYRALVVVGGRKRLMGVANGWWDSGTRGGGCKRVVAGRGLLLACIAFVGCRGPTLVFVSCHGPSAAVCGSGMVVVG